MSDVSGNPFASEEAWKPSESSDSILPVGDHVVTVQSVDQGTSSGGYPQLEIRTGNEQGSIRDWIVVIPATVGKVVQLFDAAGIDRPGDDDVNADGNGWRFADEYLYRLVDRKVGVIVREEPDRNDPSRMRTRVGGYVKEDQVSASDVPGAAPGEFEHAGQGKQDDFPF